MFVDPFADRVALGGGAAPVHDDLSRRGFLTAAGAVTVAAAGCGIATPAVAPQAATRTVDHPLGTTVVPVTPQRVVSLDSNGALQVGLEVGSPLIASETLQGEVPIPGYLPPPPAGFESLGFDQLNLERLAALHPDLIIGNMSRVEETYDKLSAIAPTVPYQNAGQGTDWRESVRVIGDVLGARRVIDERLDAYARRTATLAADHAAAIARYSVALLRFTTDELRIVRGGIFGSAILEHAGIRRPPSTDLPSDNRNYVPLSQETVGAIADADVLLYFVGGGGFTANAAETFRRYTTGGIWEQLPAVRAGRVIELDPVAWWDGYSVSAAMTCLDALDAALAGL